MATDDIDLSSIKRTRNILAIRKNSEFQGNVFCTNDNWEESLLTLSEELESFGLLPIVGDENDLKTIGLLKETCIDLVNAFWKFIFKHRMLMKSHDQLNDVHFKTANDNNNLKNQVKRLKDDIKKKDDLLVQAKEGERRLKVQYENTSRDLKRERDEVLKLRKQLQSKDSQHQHEMRRVTQSGQKLQEQLQKSIGTYVPKDQVVQNLQTEYKKEKSAYKKIIQRLEDNNRQMLEEINELKESLALHRQGIDLQIEASGIWTEAGY
ncbi:afadin- and alpha-actinin-binding protein-like [Prorops nasuta]|uniref:afadin- and alpha-actinin-binding protein-like n=1 Tax=Prorops nasuta TaxID=863751 RepID=UPI0034CF01EB